MRAVSQPKPYHLLVVEDDESVAAAISLLAKGVGSVEVVSTVADANDAIARLTGPVAALVDLGLPDGSGYEVIETLRSRIPDAPVMVLTGNMAPEAVNRVHLLRAEFVSKPEFSANLRDFLSRAGESMRTDTPEVLDPASTSSAETEVTADAPIDPFHLLAPLLSSVTHELTKPLSYLAVNLAMLQEEIDGEERGPIQADHREILDDALCGAKRIGDLLQDFGVLSRANRGGRVAYDVEAIARAAVRLCQHAIRPRALLVEEYEDVNPVGVEPAGLQRILVYLIIAAASRLPSRAPLTNRLSISARSERAGVRIEIRAAHGKRDAGESISADDPGGIGATMLVQLARGWVAQAGGDLVETIAADAGAEHHGSDDHRQESSLMIWLPRADTGLS